LWATRHGAYSKERLSKSKAKSQTMRNVLLRMEGADEQEIKVLIQKY
jgi:hypothetical protein